MLKSKLAKKIISLILCVSFLFCFDFSFEVNALTPPTLSGSTYSVSSASQLRWIAGVCNGSISAGSKNYPSNPSFSGYTIVLKNNISVGSVTKRGDEYVLSGGDVWVPIGTEKTPFSGTFNGNEFSVNGVFNVGTEDAAGFFGVIKNGTVSNLTVKGYVSGKTVAGGIVGKLSGTVSGCIFAGSVDGKTRTGGIAGEALGTEASPSSLYLNVSACEINAFGGECAGGIAGYAEYSNIASCSGGVNLYSFATSTGGILGLSGDGVSVSCCSTEGIVTSDGDNTFAGGILGQSAGEVSLLNNSFGGEVYSSGKYNSYCGGIAGSYEGKIENSFVNGGVYSALYLSEEETEAEKACVSAGIAAKTTSGEINNCYFSGISQRMGEIGDDICPEGSAVVENTFYSVGIAYVLYGTDELYHVMALLSELKGWTSSKTGYSSWQSVSGINENKPLLKHTNAAGSNGEHAWKVEGTVFTYYTDGDMEDYSENEYGIINTPWAVYRASMKTVKIKEGVTRIGNNAFSAFDNLRTLTLPSTLKEIGDYSFEQCVYLKNFTIPASVNDIGEGAFRRCKALTKITLPKNVKSVRKYTFAYCEKLASVSVPNTVSLIGYMAFAGCDALVSVALPESVREIDDYAFYWCDKLSTVSLPTGLNRIGEYAFGRCEVLVNYKIPENTIVGENAFWSDLPKGDIDGDGHYTVYDYLKVKAYLLGVLALTPTEIKNADSDFDGVVTTVDYIHVKQQLFAKK